MMSKCSSKYLNGRNPFSLKTVKQVPANSTNGCLKFDSQWLKGDPMVLVLGFMGWTIPSTIPVSGFSGASLFSKFTDCIRYELAHFPTGPAASSDFWIYLALYHAGLFLCLLLGQIGVQGRKQGYFE